MPPPDKILLCLPLMADKERHPVHKYKEREAVMDPKKRQRISAIIIVIVIAALVVTSIVPMMI